MTKPEILAAILTPLLLIVLSFGTLVIILIARRYRRIAASSDALDNSLKCQQCIDNYNADDSKYEQLDSPKVSVPQHWPPPAVQKSYERTTRFSLHPVPVPSQSPPPQYNTQSNISTPILSESVREHIKEKPLPLTTAPIVRNPSNLSAKYTLPQFSFERQSSNTRQSKTASMKTYRSSTSFVGALRSMLSKGSRPSTAGSAHSNPRSRPSTAHNNDTEQVEEKEIETSRAMIIRRSRRHERRVVMVPMIHVRSPSSTLIMEEGETSSHKNKIDAGKEISSVIEDHDISISTVSSSQDASTRPTTMFAFPTNKIERTTSSERTDDGVRTRIGSMMMRPWSISANPSDFSPSDDSCHKRNTQATVSSTAPSSQTFGVNYHSGTSGTEDGGESDGVDISEDGSEFALPSTTEVPPPIPRIPSQYISIGHSASGNSNNVEFTPNAENEASKIPLPVSPTSSDLGELSNSIVPSSSS